MADTGDEDVTAFEVSSSDDFWLSKPTENVDPHSFDIPFEPLSISRLVSLTHGQTEASFVDSAMRSIHHYFGADGLQGTCVGCYAVGNQDYRTHTVNDCPDRMGGRCGEYYAYWRLSFHFPFPHCTSCWAPPLPSLSHTPYPAPCFSRPCKSPGLPGDFWSGIPYVVFHSTVLMEFMISVFHIPPAVFEDVSLFIQWAQTPQPNTGSVLNVHILVLAYLFLRNATDENSSRGHPFVVTLDRKLERISSLHPPKFCIKPHVRFVPPFHTMFLHCFFLSFFFLLYTLIFIVNFSLKRKTTVGENVILVGYVIAHKHRSLHWSTNVSPTASILETRRPPPRALVPD